MNHLRVAIYARKSQEDKRESSIETQIAVCKEFVESYPEMKLIKVYAEDNVSGMFTDQRNQFLALQSSVEKHELDAVVCMRLDRLNRDAANAFLTFKYFALNQCYIIAGDDVADTRTPAGELSRGLLVILNQYTSRIAASSDMAGEINNAKQGKTSGGRAPYGLKIANKRYEINEDEAPAVRLIFESIAKGNSYKQVIEKLDHAGYTTRSGTRFQSTTLNAILKNEKYMGTLVYNRGGGKDRPHKVLIDRFDEVRNVGAIPAIIQPKLFEKVQ